MRSFAIAAVAALSALIPSTLAQTYTACNPLNTTGCPDMTALGGNATFQFNDTMSSKIWTQHNQGKVDWDKKGTTLTVARRGDSPHVQSVFYMLFGRMEVIMQAAPGQGIISSAILQSETLDEIDFEFLGGNKTHVFTNFYGKGINTTSNPPRNAEYKMEDAPQDDFHNYTVDWTKERIEWWVDGELLRTLKYDDPETDGGKQFPQTPMNIRLGVWAGGDTENNNEGTVSWAGGATDFGKAPYTMVVQEVTAEDYTSAAKYSWADMDQSGSWQKVKIIEGKSEALQEIEKPSGVRNRWAALSKGAQIGIIAAIIGVVAIGAAGLAFYFFRQRRIGRAEYAKHLADENKEHSELLEYQSRMPTNKAGYGRV